MNEYLQTLKNTFREHSNPEVAKGQKAYMRNQFEFLGLKTTERRALQKPFLLKEQLPSKEELPQLVKALWEEPEREFQLFGQELVLKYSKRSEPEDMQLLEEMVIQKSWWDTVDFISSKLMGDYFKAYPELRKFYADKWLPSGNMWLQRSAVLFQLKYKQETDTDLLESVICRLLGSKEFFINKAIGWVLREYGKTDPHWVASFVERHELSNLSRREALKNLTGF